MDSFRRRLFLAGLKFDLEGRLTLHLPNPPEAGWQVAALDA